jgi:1-acyl-sn-glycerol-3-phosphate acyltransferase
MHYKYARLPLISSLVERGIIIPIAQAKEDAELLRKARDEISRGLKNGDAICIFPEGRLTRDGEVDTFRPGVEQILEQDPVPVLPLALRGLWGSIFSYDKRRTLGVLPKRFRSRIELCVGKLRQAHESSAACLQQVVTELRGLER